MDHTLERPVASSTALHLLLNRQSSGALVEPAPSGADLDLILDAGLRAPDHGRLRPWRFVLIRGDARLAWAERMAEAIRLRDPENADAMIDKYRAWVQRTPLIVPLRSAPSGAMLRTTASSPAATTPSARTRTAISAPPNSFGA